MAFSTSARKLRTGLSVGILIGGLAVIAVNNRPTPHTPSDAAGGVSALLERLELTFYDMVSRREAGERPASSDIVLVTIDDTSLDYARDTLNYSWPWPRTAMGRIVQELRALGAKLVVLDLIFPDESCREEDTPEEFARMLEEAGNTVLAFNFVKQQFFARNPGEGRWAIQQGSYASRTEAVLAARGLLGMQIPKPYVVTREGRYELWLGWYSNRALATEDIKVRRAVLKLDPKGQPPVQHIPVELAPEEVTLQHVFAERNTVRVSGSTGINTKDGDILLPVAGLAASEVRFGAVDARPDTDGVWRTAEYLHKYEGRYYPSLAMAAAMLLAGTDEVTARDHRLHLGPYSVPLDENGRTTLRFYGIPDPVTNSPYTTLPISAVIAEVGRREVGRRQDARLRELLDGKIVFVSNEASSLVDVKPTPVSDRSSGTLGQVTALENLLRSEGLVRAPRSLDAVLAFFLSFMGAMLSVASTRTTRMRRTALVELVLGALIVGGYLHWISVWYRGGLWVSAVLPLGGFVAALFVATAINYADESKTAGVVTDALGRYTSPAIVDEILRNPRYLSLEGDARELTVFFSDIKDFTTISERLPAQQLVRMLNDYLTAVTEVIGRTHGHVDKFIGDAVMAYWGAPIPNKLHAVDACRCAIQLRDLLTKKRPEWKEKYGLELYARAGLNTGEMVVGNMGSKGARQKVNYTVIGDAVNLASRLEGTNKVYGTEILIGEGTFEAARDYIEVREIDLVRVKGKQRPARIFELLCMKGELTPEQRRFVEQFEAAIITYRKREFVEAAALFEAVLAERPSDGPSAIYLARCRAYVDHPPDPEWDGVFEMTGK